MNHTFMHPVVTEIPPFYASSDEPCLDGFHDIVKSANEELAVVLAEDLATDPSIEVIA